MKNHSTYIASLLCLLWLLSPSAPRTQQPPASSPLARLILVPIDDRPAVGQFAQMIGAVADCQVTMPPRELLGRFTTPGDTEGLAEWLRKQAYANVDALIVSVDMLAYGGLIASRTQAVPLADAQRRLDFFRWFKRAHPRIPVYAFNVVMRVAPTGSKRSAGYHDQLARWSELKDRVPKTGDQQLAAELDKLQRELDPQLIEDYFAARRRDLQINLALLDLVKQGAVAHLILLQDDARVYGLHRQDQAVLRARLKELRLEARVPIYNGTDEGALSLVSRAALTKFGQSPRVAVVYSSDQSKSVIAPYEDHPLQFTVENQIRAAGGVALPDGSGADYTLFVNAPATTADEFARFTARLIAGLQSKQSIALADVLFPAPHRSGADERLIAALTRAGVLDRLAGYAAWNTAGNTLGTAIPHANLRVFFRQRMNQPSARSARAEAAHIAFLVHRYAGDYLYHDIVRLQLNQRLRAEAQSPTADYEFTPEQHARISREVDEQLRAQIAGFFTAHFQGRAYKLSAQLGRAITVNGIKELRIFLPWPRTFESVVEFQLAYSMN